MGRRRNSKAFTLIELAVVLGVLAILFTIAIPAARAGDSHYRADLTAARVATDIRRIARDSVFRSAVVEIRFDKANERYELRDYLVSGSLTIVTLSEHPFRALLVDANFDSSDSIKFTGGVSNRAGVGNVAIEVGGSRYQAAIDASTGTLESLLRLTD